MRPMFLQTRFNDKQKAWDVILMLGNYKTKDEADREAGELRTLVMGADGKWQGDKNGS